VCYQLHHAAIVQTLTALRLSSKRGEGSYFVQRRQAA